MPSTAPGASAPSSTAPSSTAPHGTAPHDGAPVPAPPSGAVKPTGRFRMDRAIGLVVLALALAAAGMLWLGITLSGAPRRERPHVASIGDLLTVLYDPTLPSLATLAMAVALALFLAALVTTVEMRIARRYRRSYDGESTPLAPRVVLASTRGQFHGEVTVTVLIPAHDEEARIGATLASLRAQTQPPDRVVVVADNCKDRTAEIARAAGVEVFETVDNKHKKAGGLNQCLARVLPTMGENDCVMIMDADTVIDAGYLATARARLTSDRGLMAVGGLFYGEDGGGVLGQCQRNEYTRYSRDIERRQGKVFVLTGTASVFRARALRTVAELRGTRLPGRHGDVYDTQALTEDNEMTIALKSLGALMVSPKGCGVVTEVMPDLGALWNQRLRWQRGALENLGAYGITAQTWRYWSQQLGLGYGVIALFGYLVLMAVTALALDEFVWFPFWMGAGAIFAVERVVGVWKGTWGARLLAVLVVPELLYATYLNIIFCKGIWDILRAKQAEWGDLASTDNRLALANGGAA